MSLTKVTYNMIQGAVVNVIDYGASPTATASVNASAFQAALDTGSAVYIPQGTYSVDNTLTISNSNQIVFGDGHESKIIYTGATKRTALLYVDPAAIFNVVIKDLTLAGGTYPNQSKIKWVFYADRLGRGSQLNNVQITAGLGLIYIGKSYYGHLIDVYAHRSSPDNSNWTLAEWQEVYDANVAPINIIGGGAGTQIDRLTVERVGTQPHPTGSIVGNAVVYIEELVQVNTMTFETCGETYDTYTVQTNYGLHLRNCGPCEFNNLDIEDVGAKYASVYIQGQGGAKFSTLNVNAFSGSAGSALFLNDSILSPTFIDCTFVNISADSLFTTGNSYSNGASTVEVINCRCVTGWQEYDPAISGNNPNVYDTQIRTVNYLGLPQTLLIQPYQNLIVPKIIQGLTVSSSSDGYGQYLSVTPGVFRTEQNKIVSCEAIIFGSASTQFLYKLRPKTVSYYYRLYIGVFGNLYIEERATPFPDPRGNWIASFQTNGSGVIGSITTNPRLSYFGNYSQSGTVAVYGSAAPVSGDWLDGDIVYDSTPSAGGFVGWVCVTAGTPGTWKTFGAISV